MNREREQEIMQMNQKENLVMVDDQIAELKKLAADPKCEGQRKLKILNLSISFQEERLKILTDMQDIQSRLRFTAAIAQYFLLRETWPECRDCKKNLPTEICLEARKKTGQCILNLKIKCEDLHSLPWSKSDKEYADA